MAIALVTVTAFAIAHDAAGASSARKPRKATVKAKATVAHSAASVQAESLIASQSIGELSLNAPIVGMASTKSGKGSWRVARDGGIFTSGDAKYYGSTAHRHLNQPIVGMASTRTGRGYWFVARDGGIFTFGDARYYGSTGGTHLNQPIVAIVATRGGNGYWLVARDGGVFSFGDARFYGSTGNIHLNQPIVGGAPSPTGHGYWFVARDGGIFSFGDAHFRGSAGGSHLSQPIVGMAPASTGNGYLLLTASGRVLNFGSATNYGSAQNNCTGARAVAIATAPHARGYWIAFANAKAYALSPVSKVPHCTPPKTTKVGKAATDLFNRMNDERHARGLPSLAWDPTLAGYAAKWSRTMGGGQDLHHSDIGSLLGTYDYVGENIANGSGNVPASALHVAWMHSSEHRDNILSPGYQTAGVGVYCAPDGSIWATTEFARPSSAGSPPSYSGGTAPNPVARADADTTGC